MLMIDEPESIASESARQWVHIGSGLFAVLLRFLTWWQAAVLAIVALAFNALVLPRVGGRRLFRPVDRLRGFPIGILLYPLSVLILILAFPDRPDIVAAAWGVMACGDGFATLVGQSARSSPRLPWNEDKSVAGTAAFFLCGAAAGVALAWWTRPAVTPLPPLTFTVGAPVAAAFVAALVETIPVRLDDNISVPLSAAAVLWLVTLTSGDAVMASRGMVAANLPWAIAVNAIVSLTGYRARAVSLSGMIGGALIGVVIYAAGGWRAWALLFITFFTAAIASRFGLERKALLGIAEERGGRRGAGNAFANCGVAAIAAMAAAVTPFGDRAWLAFVAALSAGGSDTIASEIGKAWGGATFLVTSFGRVKPGTPGAMSLEGTAAGVVGALALAAVGVMLGLVPSGTVLAIVVAATAGALVESALAATLEPAKFVNNDMLNFINTAAAAALVLALT
jgi:uncharacterized protein (TIGR00297 family)